MYSTKGANEINDLGFLVDEIDHLSLLTLSLLLLPSPPPLSSSYALRLLRHRLLASLWAVVDDYPLRWSDDWPISTAV
jgi:hypothetical protein